jgi:hypothetical protein
LVLSDLAPLGVALVVAIQEAIVAADQVVVVLPNGPGALNAAFEAGLTLASGKPLTLIAAPDAALPSDLSGVLIVRAEPDDLDAISFALDQVEDRAPFQRREELPGTGHPIGRYADVLLARVDRAAAQDDVVALLVDAIEASGAAAVKSAGRDRGFDLGVWSDDLDSIAANPLLIEVSRMLTSEAIRKSTQALHQSPSARLGLIVLTEEQSSMSALIGQGFVLAIGLRHLLERLRQESFAEVVRDLRNRSAHNLPVS